MLSFSATITRARSDNWLVLIATSESLSSLTSLTLATDWAMRRAAGKTCIVPVG